MSRQLTVVGRAYIDATESIDDNPIDVRAFELVAIQMPADWDAANLTFQGKPGATLSAKAPGSNEVLQNVYDSGGTEVTVTAAADRYIVFTAAHAAALNGLAWVKIRSGTSGAAVVQNAAREIILLGVPRGE
jgi:hypothetical protein